MSSKLIGIGTAIVIGAISIIFILGAGELPYFQSSALKYNINTDCQLYTAFLSGDLNSQFIEESKINPALKLLLEDLLILDPIEEYEKIQAENPHCEDEFRKLQN